MEKVLIDNIFFKENSFSCGTETFNQALNYCFNNKITDSELYFLSYTLRFVFLEKDEKQLGYNNMDIILEGMRKNVTEQVYSIKNVSVREKVEVIYENLLKQNLVILYLDNAGSYYMDQETIWYPYHLVINYGIDPKNNEIRVADLFSEYNNKSKLKLIDLDYTKILPYTNELIIIEKNINRVLECKDHTVILKEMNSLLKCDVSGFSKIKEGIGRIELEEDFDKRRKNILATKTIILKPMLEFTKGYALERGVSPELIKEMEQLILEWDVKILKYIKFCYLKSTVNYISHFNLFTLVDDTEVCMLKILNELEVLC